MAQRIVDLTLPVVSGEYWTKYPGGMVYGQEEPPTLIECFSTIEKTTVCMHKYSSTTQSFTHIDAPRHVYDDGITNDQVPLERLVGEAAVVDLTYKQPNELVTAADLEKNGGHVRAGDIAILRSGWTERGPWGAERFWREMIYLAEDAGEWLDRKEVKALAVDFLPDLPQFYTDPNDGRLRPTDLGHPTHLRLMKKGLVFVEWCANLTSLRQPRVQFFCLPLRLVGTDGAQARVIAIEETDVPYHDLREFLGKLAANGELHRIEAEVDWDLEIGAITRRGIELGLPAMLFEKIKGFPADYRVLGNLLTPTRPVKQGRLSLALELPKDMPPGQVIEEFGRRMERRVKPRIVPTGPCKENVVKGDDVDLWQFPTPLMHAGDGGRYIGTWHITVTQDPDTRWVNWGIYRHMIHDRNTLSMLSFPPQHGGVHYRKYEERDEPMPVAIAIGPEPVCSIAADTQLPAGEDEADLTGGLRGEPIELVKCETNDLYVPATSEIVLEGFARPHERKLDGPFGEYHGYRDFHPVNLPVIEVTCITYRHSPILTISNMGKPWDEAGIISSIAQSAIVGAELKRQNIPHTAVYCPAPDFGVIIAVTPQYAGFAHTVASAVWGSKVGIHRPFVFVVGDDVDVTDPEDVYWCLVTRLNPERNIHVQRNAPGHSLFPFLSLEERRARRGSRVLFDATFPPEVETPVVMDFRHGWPDEVQAKVLDRWAEYGFK